MTTNQCEHGSLARSCLICELTAEIAALKDCANEVYAANVVRFREQAETIATLTFANESLRASNIVLRQMEDERIEEEAQDCPEDFGYHEVVLALRAEIDRQKGENSLLKQMEAEVYRQRPTRAAWLNLQAENAQLTREIEDLRQEAGYHAAFAPKGCPVCYDAGWEDALASLPLDRTSPEVEATGPANEGDTE